MEKIERRIGEFFKDGDYYIYVDDFYKYGSCDECHYFHHSNGCQNNFDISGECYDKKINIPVIFIVTSECMYKLENFRLSREALVEALVKDLHIIQIFDFILSLQGKVTKFIIKIKNKVK